MMFRWFKKREIHVHLHISEPITIVNNTSQTVNNSQEPSKKQRDSIAKKQVDYTPDFNNIDLPEVSFGEES